MGTNKGKRRSPSEEVQGEGRENRRRKSTEASAKENIENEKDSDVDSDASSEKEDNNTDEELAKNRAEEIKKSEDFLRKYDSSNSKRQLDEVERMPLEMWHTHLFQSCKYITDGMLADETNEKSIMTQAFEKMKLYTEEQKKPRREAVKRYLKMKIGKARDFFQQGVRRAVMDLGK